MTTQVEIGTLVSQPTFATLFNEVKKDVRECGMVKEAFGRAVEKYNIPAGETSEVLHCALYDKIKGRPRESSIPYSEKNLAEYVKVLRHYDVPFEDAMVMGFRQYRIEDYSPLAKQLFREVGGILGARKKRRAA